MARRTGLPGRLMELSQVKLDELFRSTPTDEILGGQSDGTVLAPSDAPLLDIAAKRHRAKTPFLTVDLSLVADRYVSLRSAFPGVQVYFAVKALAEIPVIRTLHRLGCGFDVASPAELDLCLNAGVPASAVSYGNTVKSASAISTAFAKGVRQFAFDSEGELDKLAQHAPGSEVLCRLLTSNEGADWPLSRKFGCDAEMVVDLVLRARQAGLRPTGVAFHVGSQQRDPTQWDRALEATAAVFGWAADKGLDLSCVNLGGGLPAQYTQSIPGVDEYGRAILGAVDRHFPNAAPALSIEPGRYLVGDAGVLRSSVLLVSRKSRHDDIRWVYLHVGRFEGLAETEGEAIRYRLRTSKDGGATGPAIIAGPTCDSVDILYEKTPYPLPIELDAGDTVDFLSAGAYTVCYASAGFNGFPPPPIYYTGDLDV
ncbi:MAG: type III PLP-dependent enzyme [Mycobacterium sp.]